MKYCTDVGFFCWINVWFSSPFYIFLGFRYYIHDQLLQVNFVWTIWIDFMKFLFLFKCIFLHINKSFFGGKTYNWTSKLAAFKTRNRQIVEGFIIQKLKWTFFDNISFYSTYTFPKAVMIMYFIKAPGVVFVKGSTKDCLN